MRKEATPAESVLWTALRKRQRAGHRFRRQHILGSYILDFYCIGLKLGIEVDGSIHLDQGQKAYDQDRTEILEGLGILIIRFSNADVFQRLDWVLDQIEKVLLKRECQAEGESL